MDEKNVKLAFLFGAGAEGPGNYGIRGGKEYLMDTMYPLKKVGPKNVLAFNDELRRFYSTIDSNYKYRADRYDVTHLLLGRKKSELKNKK